VIFGLDEAQWNGWTLGEGDGPSGFSLQLLEWIVPRPARTEMRELGQFGLSHLNIQVPNLAALGDRLAARVELGGDGLVVRDVDGALLELSEGGDLRLHRFVINCSSLGRSASFYVGTLGLQQFDRRSQAGFESVMLADPRGSDAFGLELREWRASTRGGPNRQPHGVGYFRLAMYVDDIRAAHSALVDAAVECVSPPGDLDLGPGAPGGSAMLFSDPDGAMLELIGPEIGSSPV
jgi:catechol 2,3-dioxygenase-like lactoylglutathione lyase family enzyme